MNSFDKLIIENNNMKAKNKIFIKKFNFDYNTLNNEIHNGLEEFYKTYPYYKVYGNSEKYKIKMNSIHTNMDKINNDIFLLDNTIEKKVIDINKVIHNMNMKLKEAKKLNKSLKEKSNNLEEGALSSEQLFEDEKTTYQTNVLNIIIYVIAYAYIGNSIYKLIKK